MKVRSIPQSLGAWGSNWAKGPARARCGPQSPHGQKSAILLISDDAHLGENLRLAAAHTGRTVVQAAGAADALPKMRAGQPLAVLLDLDLAALAAWEAADRLLREASCPPLILLTARADQFDVSAAVRAGLLIDKTTDPDRLLELVDQAVTTTGSEQAERNYIQRIVIQWLRPCSWPVPVTPAYRFSGIND